MRWNARTPHLTLPLRFPVPARGFRGRSLSPEDTKALRCSLCAAVIHELAGELNRTAATHGDTLLGNQVAVLFMQL